MQAAQGYISTDISFQTESLAQVSKDAVPLLVDHWEEVAMNKDKIQLSPNWEAYYALEAAGNLKIFTARESSILIGYFAVSIAYHPHYKEHLFGTNDVIFISEEYREQGLGAQMIGFAEKHLKELGCSVLVINTKTSHPFDSLLNTAGFTLGERVYSKYIGE